MRNTYLKLLYQLAKEDERIVSLVADNGLIVYDDFKRDFPDRYFNFGIAEENMVAAAAGMASCGLIPFVYTISSFLAYRSYEFIRDDVCLQNQNVKIVGIGTGLTYSSLGPTHHTTEDIGLLRGIPNLRVFCPATATECEWVIKSAYENEGPVYIRLGNNNRDYYEGVDPNFVVGNPSIVKDGTDVALFTTGTILNEVMDAATALENVGISCKVISIVSIKPMNKMMILEAIGDCKTIVSIEEHNVINGLGSAIADSLVSEPNKYPLFKIGLEDTFAEGYGKLEEVRKINNLDASSIVKRIKKVIEKENRSGR